MSFCSKNISPKNSHDDDINIGSMLITDEHIKEIEDLIPSTRKSVTTNEVQLKEAARRILEHPCAVISNCSLTERIDYDAANFLVEQCLLLFTGDLFNDHSQLDPGGYVKYIPETIDLIFMGRLIHYDIDPGSYFNNIDIPEIWISYLSTNGIKFLTTMNIYRNILRLTSPPEKPTSSSSVNKLDDNLADKNYHNINKTDFISDVTQKNFKHSNDIKIMNAIDESSINRCNEPPAKKSLDIPQDSNHIRQLSNQGKFCSVCELTKIISLIHPSSKNQYREVNHSNIPSADSIRNNVHLISSVFCVGNQEDVSEFILMLFSHCISCFPLHFSASLTMSLYPTIIDQIFTIKLLSCGQCPSCLYMFQNQEIINMLLIEIDNLNELNDALAHFVHREAIHDFKCSNCDQSVKIDKRITIDELSPILIVNFKRCTMTFDSTEKLVHRVNYNELLDMSPYMTSNSCISNDKDQNVNLSNTYCYKLYAVINHVGTNLNSGHYYAYIRSSDDIWFLIDDAKCRNVSASEVLGHSEALILFYAKLSYSSTNTSTSVKQNKHQLMTSTPANNRVSYSSILSSSVMHNSTPINRHSWVKDERPSNNNHADPAESQRSFPLELLNTSSIANSPDNSVLNDEPLPGQTESSITICTRFSTDSIEKKRKNIDDTFNKELPCSSMSYSNTSHDEDRRKENCKKLASVASGVMIEEIYERTLPQKHDFRLNQTEIVKLNLFRQQYLNKESDRKMRSMGLAPETLTVKTSQSKTSIRSTSTNDKNDDTSYKKNNDVKSNRKVNIEYLNLLLPHLKHYNAACGLCVRSRYFGKNVSKSNALLVRCILKCNGRSCKFKCTVQVLNNGFCFVIALNRKIFHHVGERIGRPIRGSRRQAIIDKFKSGASVYRLHSQYHEQRSKNEKKGFNYDSTGKSKKVFKKIKAEATAESLLSPDVTLGILQLHDKLADEINNDGIITGALQVVQFRPFCTVAFTEASIRLYDAIVSHPETVLSWDATGGIIKNTALSSRQCLYYELTVSHPNVVNEDTLIPLTFMLSESQTLLTITNWLTTFKESYKKIFPHKKDSFPRPAVILSDRAQIFLQAALRIYNDENYQQFLARAYRIVTNQAIQDDLFKTIIHACLSHFMFDMRKRINKYLPEDIREFAMWCMALLVNTGKWNEMKENWRLMCRLFINYSTNETLDFKQSYSILLSRISHITNDPNSSKRFAWIIDEEKQLNEVDSNFKKDLQQIYHECYQDNAKSIAEISSSANKAAKSARQWLAYINQYCMPTVAIWSNLLLGNLSRYIISSIAAYDKLLLNTHDQRTNAISERRMAIVKRTQLGTQTYTRADVVLQILIQDMQKLIENFSLSYMAASSKDTNTETNQQQLKELTENWRKNNRRGHGFYAKKPDTSIMNNLKYTLVVYSTTINDGLSVPHLPVPNWLNIAIGTLVSIKSIRTSSSLSPKVSTSLINDIINFITKWISSAEYIKRTKKHSAELMHLLNSKFQIPPDIPPEGCGQLNFILHKILLPIIDRYIPAVKEYCCTSCNCTVRTRFSISYIPINMVEVQTQLHHRLNSYFDGCMSDHLCDKCSMTMSRRIKLLECPPVIILRIDYNNVSSTVLRKPPNAIFFQSFLEKTNIGCSSSTIYDVVAFISIMPNTDNKLVLGTKIKQRWRINSMTKLIGNGEKLCKLFANSRLIILERTRTCNSNFIYAIAQCCSFTISNIEHNDFCTCNTLNDAIKIIESEAKLNYLYSMLSSHFTTYYQCQQCRCSPSSLSTTNNGVSIYEQNMEPKFICGSPLTSLDRLDLSCSVCNKKTEDVLLPVHSQIHHQCPPICMYYSQRTILHGVQNLRIELASHDSQSICAYQAISVLLIDEYNGISVVKLDRVSIYCTNPYQTVTTSSVDKINEAFHTAQKTIIFLKKIATPEPSTTLVLQAPVPVRLINKSSGVLVIGSIKSLTIAK
ncbi:unnamed protein product [Rotaria magnacalcarata]|uniref:USP domain-containing protein n=1 Tax=Rotaria magnacalcarata TaxID=392030 RepID=A0A816XEY8_9BILA|nr:unnamed protein product [Rotaria magnacalcarata]